MTEDLIWLQQQHDCLAEEVQRSRIFLGYSKECQQDLTLFWNDACAREMNGRFLVQMVEDAAHALENLELQLNALTGCWNELAEAQRLLASAAEVSAVAHHEMEGSAAVFRNIESILAQALSEARSADDHVKKANQACNDADSAGAAAQCESAYRG